MQTDNKKAPVSSKQETEANGFRGTTLIDIIMPAPGIGPVKIRRTNPASHGNGEEPRFRLNPFGASAEMLKGQ